MGRDFPIIGVLALQGAVQPHQPHIEAAGGIFKAVKTPEQFEQVDAFILPGGESTTMLKLIETFGLWDALAQQFKAKPVWGICAGSILMAETVYRSSSDEACQRDDGRVLQKSFGLIPITVERNGYGRQLDSHHAQVEGYEVSFIRAPVMKLPSPLIPLPEGRGKGGAKPRQGEGIKIIAMHQGDPVWLEYGPYMMTSFHPELTLDYPSPMHRAFVDLVKNAQKIRAA